MPFRDCQKLIFRMVGCDVSIDCRDRTAAELILANYGAMQTYEADNPGLEYEIRRRNGSGFRLVRQGRKG